MKDGDRLTLHQDAQIAAIVWAKLLPSFSGSVICSSFQAVGLGNRVMSRSLAIINSATCSERIPGGLTENTRGTK